MFNCVNTQSSNVKRSCHFTIMFIAITLDNQMTNILSFIEDSSDFLMKPSAEKNYFTNHILNKFFLTIA